MSVRESGEMYLEAILVLHKEKGEVRSVDVSEYLGYSKPSVSRAVGILRKDGYLTMDPHGSLTLTPLGQAHAEKIYERHTLITKLLEALGVDPQTAADDACKIEHAISDTSFQALKNYASEKNIL